MEYNIQNNIGKAKYVVNYYRGKKHKDGSKFWDIAIFKSKHKMNQFIKTLKEPKRISNRRKNLIAAQTEIYNNF